MIPVDYSGVVFSALHVELADSGMNTITEDYVRHLILSILKSYNSKFKDKYGEMVICLDSKTGYWRKKIFPYYKGKRAESRTASALDWDQIFETVNNITEELSKVLPWKFIRVDKAEADDVMAVLARFAPEITPTNVLGEMEYKVLVISNDKDMIQLQKDDWIKNYSPRKKAMISEADPKMFLLEQILRGDPGDGIPNIRSDADTLMDESKRQKPITTKFIKTFLDSGISSLSSFEQGRYMDNQKLIDLSMIPATLQQSIRDAYINYPELPPKRKLLAYFAAKGLKKMAESIHQF